MLDVHPPHEAAHTWKDFLIHIATIVIGLLIAVGLEQTVEALHHRHQLHELRDALQQDNGKALRDDVDIEASARNEITWLTARINDLTAALHDNTTPHFIPHLHVEVKAIPVDPAWRAAKSNNLIDVMPPDEVPAFTEVDELLTQLNIYMNTVQPKARRSAFEQQFRTSPTSPTFDFSRATHADLVQDLILLSEERDNERLLYMYALYVRGCLTAMNRGERDLDKLNDSENNTEAPYWSFTHRDDAENQPLTDK
jgi:hypothetical protein